MTTSRDAQAPGGRVAFNEPARMFDPVPGIPVEIQQMSIGGGRGRGGQTDGEESLEEHWPPRRSRGEKSNESKTHRAAERKKKRKENQSLTCPRTPIIVGVTTNECR